MATPVIDILVIIEMDLSFLGLFKYFKAIKVSNFNLVYLEKYNCSKGEDQQAELYNYIIRTGILSIIGVFF